MPQAARVRGLAVPADLTFNDWLDLGKGLRAALGDLQWRIGDWLMAADERWGDTYAKAQALLDMDYANLSQLKRVSTAFPLEQRIYDLSHTHYREAMRLDEALRMPALAKAANDDMPLRLFRIHCTELNRNRSNRWSLPHPRRASAPPPTDYREGLGHPSACPKCGHEFTCHG